MNTPLLPRSWLDPRAGLGDAPLEVQLSCHRNRSLVAIALEPGATSK